ncbi:MAG: response regulator transcription factor [Pseudomonadales bacterium]|jgi:DNA-binding response OmpR family regulator
MTVPLILVVEDEADIREVVLYNLRREGYEAIGCETGTQALSAIKMKRPDLVILDLMIPELDGLTVCQQVRADPEVSSTPIVIVSAKEEESDVVIGLGLGADDYVAKPFRPKELMARVKAVLRRAQKLGKHEQQKRIVIGDLMVDLDKHQVTLAGELIYLTASEFRLFYQLASNPGKAFSREQLLKSVVGDRTIVVDRNIDVHIRSVRKKIGAYAERVQTIRGIGYRFTET